MPDINKLYVEVQDLRKVLLEDSNIDILLYLAKYNPKVSRKDLSERFGRSSLSGLRDLKRFHLVDEERGFLQLTTEGIFQVEGLMTLVG